jgi:hypothetical protein
VTRALVDYVAPWLVDHPDELEVREVAGEGTSVLLEIVVNPEDVGKLIGKRGRIIRSLRALAKAAGQRTGQTVMVEVVD